MMISEASAIRKLAEFGIEFTTNEFKLSISKPDKSQIFNWFICAGITKKIRNLNRLLKYCVRRGSAEKTRVLLAHLQVKTLSEELFYELISRAAFEQFDVPDSQSAIQWRTLANDFMMEAEGVNFLEIKNLGFSDRRASEEQSCLRLAVSMKDHQLVHSLIKKGSVVDFRFSGDSYLQGGNLLHLISRQNEIIEADVTITETLIREGIEIDLQDNNHNTPLALCAISGAYEIARTLINNGADVNIKVGPNEDRTVLMYSIIHDHYATAKLLMGCDADIHHRDRNGWTAARLAFNRRNRIIGDALLAKGAVVRPFIGISGLPVESGGIRVDVLDNTASGSAYFAGLRVNDILVKADCQLINSIQELISIVGSKQPLAKISITAIREGLVLDFEVEVQAI